MVSCVFKCFCMLHSVVIVCKLNVVRTHGWCLLLSLAQEVFADNNEENCLFQVANLVLLPTHHPVNLVSLRCLWWAKIFILLEWESLLIKIIKITFMSGRKNIQWCFQILGKLLCKVRKVDVQVLTIDIWASL